MWLADVKGDRQAAEATLNYWYVLYYFCHNFVDRDTWPARDQVIWLGRLVKKLWQTKFDQEFPGRRVIVSFCEDGDDLSNLEITFFHAPTEVAGDSSTAPDSRRI